MKILSNFTITNPKINQYPLQQGRYNLLCNSAEDTFEYTTQPSFKGGQESIKEISANLIKNYKATKKINRNEVKKVANKIADYIASHSSSHPASLMEFINEFKEHKVLLKEIYKSKMFDKDGEECGIFLTDMQVGMDTWQNFRELFAPFKDDDKSLREILFHNVSLGYFDKRKTPLIQELSFDNLLEIVPNIKSVSLFDCRYEINSLSSFSISTLTLSNACVSISFVR